MDSKSVFKRYEIKFLIKKEQKERLLKIMEPYMHIDEFGRTNIRSIYFDTDSYMLIRRSIEKPCYKEKLRVRSYGNCGDSDEVFVELKKKYKHVVYKRRVQLTKHDAHDWLLGLEECPLHSQIASEIEYAKDFYGNLRPAMYICASREAYAEKDGGELRITFDDSIYARANDISLEDASCDVPITDPDVSVMEVKTQRALPLWLADFLAKERIVKTSFSKYGTAYKMLVLRERGVKDA